MTDPSHQLRHCQTLCQQQTERISSLEATLKQSWLRSSALLALNSHLINEYSPFDTPTLRTELALLHKKCCTLHRDCELSKESAFQKDNTIALLGNKLTEASAQVETHQNEAEALKAKLDAVEEELLCCSQERTNLAEILEQTRQELCSEKEAHMSVESRLEQLEISCRSDKKYRDLKEKVSTYQKEVDSLNVVVDMKTQRTRHLESEIMRIELELSNYENLKEAYQRLQRENEALTETLGMKARKNAEQSREIEHLRCELKREANDHKRASILNDQLEYQLNETRERLHEVSFSSDFAANDNNLDCDPKDASSIVRFNSLIDSVTQSTSSKHASFSQRPLGRNYVRRLFSTPSVTNNDFQSRQHYQHQDPATHSKHRLPELVLSSIGANWSVNRAVSSSTNFHGHGSTSHHPHSHADLHCGSSSNNSSGHSSPIASPKMDNTTTDTFMDFPNPPVSNT